MTTWDIFAKKPIPQLHSMLGWKQIPIKDCGEKMIMIRESERISVQPVYYLKGYKTAIKDIFVREGVAGRLEKAAEMLPRGYRIVIFDGWRPLSLQRELFEEQIEKLKTRGVPPNLIMEEAQKYVSYPSEDPISPPPHFTGGAVDLSITSPSGLLDMGCEFDTWGEIAHVRHYEELLSQKKLPHVGHNVIKNRRRIFHTLIEAGFASYPEEWWHFDYGNQFWARATNAPMAIYGRANSMVKL